MIFEDKHYFLPPHVYCKLYLIIFSLIFYISYSQHDGFSQFGWEKQKEIEKIFQDLIDKSSFKKHLIKLTERPHVVGSDGNEEVKLQQKQTGGQFNKDASFEINDEFSSKAQLFSVRL